MSAFYKVFQRQQRQFVLVSNIDDDDDDDVEVFRDEIPCPLTAKDINYIQAKVVPTSLNGSKITIFILRNR